MIDIKTTKEFDKLVRESVDPVLVEFCTSTCGPCKVTKIMLNEFEMAEGVRTYSVDCEVLPELASEFNVGGVPTIVLFERGEPLNSITGSTNKQAIRDMVC